MISLIFEDPEQEVGDVLEEFNQFMALTPARPTNGSLPDARAWWTLEKRARYPNMFSLYRKWCSVPGSSTSVERLWSIATRVDNRLRSRLAPETMISLLFFIKAFKFFEGVDVGEDDDETPDPKRPRFE